MASLPGDGDWKIRVYRCRNLKTADPYGQPAGYRRRAFTGCHLEEVEIHFYQGREKGLKSIVDEIRFTQSVRNFIDHRRRGGQRRIYRDGKKYYFQEHYEEAVENTPARILETTPP